MTIWLALLALASEVTPPSATDPAPPQAAEAPALPAGNGPIVVQGQAEKKICHTETATGSIMPRRICRTELQIAQQETQARQTLERITQDRQAREGVENQRGTR